MNKVVGVVAAAVIAVGGYFGGQAMGLFGASALSQEEIMTVLEARAKEINDSGDLKYDGFSRLIKAEHTQRTLIVQAKSTRNLSDLAGGQGAEVYLASRVSQAANFLCHDETTRAALAGGAKYRYNWKSADDKEIGLVTATGKSYCTDAGY